MARSPDNRWDERKLNADIRPKVQYEYFVSGHGYFPYDMLRHDSAWPARTVDVFIEGDRMFRSIKLRSYRAPTIDRWSSFGWSVGFVAVMEEV